MPDWFFASLHGHRIGWLPRDIVAGVVLAAIAIPGSWRPPAGGHAA
jgi:MFS superfamily sulfate permease-like transporter